MSPEDAHGLAFCKVEEGLEERENRTKDWPVLQTVSRVAASDRQQAGSVT